MSNKNSPTKYSEDLKKPSSLFINPAKLMLTSRKNMASPLPLFLTGFENTPKFEWTKILFSLPSRLKHFNAATLNWKRRILS